MGNDRLSGNAGKRKGSMSGHLMRVNLLALTLPVTFLLLVLLYLVMRDARETSIAQRRANLRQQAAMVDRLPAELAAMAVYLQQDTRLNRLCSKTMADPYETLLAEREITRMMVLAKNFFSSRGYEIAILSANGLNIYSKSDAAWTLQLENLSGETWYGEVQQAGGALRHLSPGESPLLRQAMPQAACFSVCPLVNLTSARKLGIIVFEIPLQAIDLGGGDDRYALVDGSGNTVASSSMLPLEWACPLQDMAVMRISGSPMQLLIQRDVFGSWTLVSASPARPALTSTVMLLIALGGIIALLALLMGRYTGAYIARQTKPLLDSIARTAEGDLSSRMILAQTQELDRICQGYNRMLSRVEELMSNVEVKEQEKAALAMDALRAQIHPHFLYNTVASIRYLLQSGRLGDADRSLIALVRLLRATFAERGEIIPLEKELSFLQSYADIMAIRYQDSFSFTRHATAEALSCGVLMWTLQPLMENSITHGFNQKSGVGHITLTAACEDGCLVIRLADDGTTENAGRIESALTGNAIPSPEQGRFNGIGIGNIMQRIRTRFGAPYGISAQPNEQGGMTVTMRLPIMHLQEEAHADRHCG